MPKCAEQHGAGGDERCLRYGCGSAKGDAAELVLDGNLIGERTEEINLAKLLRVAQREFDADTQTFDEALLHRQWPALRDRLTTAMTRWDAAPGIPIALPLTAASPPAQTSAGVQPEHRTVRGLQ